VIVANSTVASASWSILLRLSVSPIARRLPPSAGLSALDWMIARATAPTPATIRLGSVAETVTSPPFAVTVA
jgi:hypothetical protein